MQKIGIYMEDIRVSTLMMQKNEKVLLEKWIKYHKEIVGLDNITIFDNGSTNDETINILKKYEKSGLKVIWTHNTQKDFELKGTILGNEILALQESTNCDFFFPLDCDEFLAVELENSKISCEKEDIFAELKKYVGSKDILMIKKQLFNSPISDEWFWPRPDRKCFFYKNNFLSMDVGFHWAKNKHSTTELQTKIVQFHFHNKPYSVAQEHAKAKLLSRVDDFSLETLRNYKGAGVHLVDYFLFSESEIVNNLLNKKYTPCKALKYKLAELEIAWPYADEIAKSCHRVNEARAQICQGTGIDAKVQHKQIMSSVDRVELIGSTLRLIGWGFGITHDKKVSEIKSMAIVIDNKCVIGNIEARSSRADVKAVHNSAPIESGFVANFNVSDLTRQNEKITSVAFFMDIRERSLGQIIQFNKASTILSLLN
jgi:hypothetical protein